MSAKGYHNGDDVFIAWSRKVPSRAVGEFALLQRR
ncbi:MAG: hypothetical protein OJF51_002975 [Nitrospira sp.]|jgi:hypothetical protein|nr:MAG: hypothetical protein OJF51_002975 [Nitrospira sp.]